MGNVTEPFLHMSVTDVGLAEGLNSFCHTYTGGMSRNQRHVIRTPKIVVILWGHYYVATASAVSEARRLISDLITGPFMNGLAQYGIMRGAIVSTKVIDTDTPASNPAPTTQSKDEIQAQLVTWFNDGTVSPRPSVNETNLVYMLFPPPSTKLTYAGTACSPDGDLCGYHEHGKYNSSSNNDDLFFTIVCTRRARQSTGLAFMKDLSLCVSHEIAEALSDRDDEGFVAKNLGVKKDKSCEIGDTCEQNSFTYRDWSVEQYWSNWDNNCIDGVQTVSLRKYLAEIHFDTNRGLRALGTATINTDYIAVTMASTPKPE